MKQIVKLNKKMYNKYGINFIEFSQWQGYYNHCTNEYWRENIRVNKTFTDNEIDEMMTNKL